MLEFALAFALTMLYGSVLEWIIHRHIMHSPRFSLPYRRHTVEHHSQRKAPGRYCARPEEEAAYHLFETSYMPVVWILNAPFYGLLYLAGGRGAFLGGLVGAAFYILAYEVLHWYMHCPHRCPFKGHGWFRFLSEHHRRHHKRSRINYNVVCPLADLLFGTFSSETIPPEP